MGKKSREGFPQIEVPRSLRLAQRGARTAHDFSQIMSALMGDLISGAITAAVGNATVNAAGKILKVVELQQKYGRTDPVTNDKTLQLS